MGRNIEKHPFTPLLPKDAKVVICGTFPPKREKWAMDFFYPNYYNDMWRVFGLIFFNDKDHFFNPSEKTIDKEGIISMLMLHDIGMGETAKEVVRLKDNASDKYLEIVKPVDLKKLLIKVPACRIVATTGEKAASVISSITRTPTPKMGETVPFVINLKNEEERQLLHWRLPSTSRAYPMKIDEKARYYADMLKFLNIIE